jgi:hypothetical protein
MNEQDSSGFTSAPQTDGFTSAPETSGFTSAPNTEGFSSAPAVNNAPAANSASVPEATSAPAPEAASAPIPETASAPVPEAASAPAQSSSGGYTPPPSGYTPPAGSTLPAADMESVKSIVKGIFTKPLSTIENQAFGFTEAIILAAVQVVVGLLFLLIRQPITVILIPISILGYAVLFAAVAAIIILFGKYVFKSETFDPKKDWKDLFCSVETALFPYTAALVVYLVFFILKINFFSFIVSAAFFFSMMLGVPVIKKNFGFDNDKALLAAGVIAAASYLAYTIII